MITEFSPSAASRAGIAVAQSRRSLKPPSRTRRRLYLGAIALVALLLGSGCHSHLSSDHRATASPKTTKVPTSSISSATKTPTSVKAVAGPPAVIAFTRYIDATYNAQRAPRQPGQTYTPVANFPRYSFDPIRTQESAYIASLATSGEAFHGAPPKPRVNVVRSEPDAKPYPTVVLTNCPTPAPTWAAYDTKTGKPVAYTKAEVPSPYLATATVIFYEGHWGVQKISVDTGRTCTA